MLSLTTIIQERNIELAGQFFISLAIEDFEKKEYVEAYSNIRRGLSLITCDDLIDDWKISIKKISLSYSSKIVDFDKFNFCRAFFLNYEVDDKCTYLALDAIEEFLKSNSSDDIGLYIYGRVLYNLGRFEDSLSAYQSSILIQQSAKALYRIGQIKENLFDDYGGEEICNAYLLNPTSIACCLTLRQCSRERDILPGNLIVDKENPILKKFISNIDLATFQKEFELLSNLGSKTKEPSTLAQRSAFDQFVDELKNLQYLFSREEYEYRKEEEKEDFTDYEPDYDALLFEVAYEGGGEGMSYSDYVGDNYDEREENGYWDRLDEL